LSFIDFSTPDTVQYLIMDEDAFYKWHVTNEHVKNVKNWLSDRQTYNFKLKFSNNYTTVEIVVYRGDECLLREEIQPVDFL
jgi:hypothetical protein